MKKHNPELVNYIEKELAKDIPVDKIRKVLLYVGHNKDVVEASISHVLRRKRTHRILVGGFIAFIVIGVLIIGFMLANNNTGNSYVKPNDSNNNSNGKIINVSNNKISENTTVTTVTTTTLSKEEEMFRNATLNYNYDKNIMKSVLNMFNLTECSKLKESLAKSDCEFYVRYCKNPDDDIVLSRCEDIKNEFK